MAIFRVPRITATQRSVLLLDIGEIVYDTDQNIFYGGNGVEVGGFPIGSGTGAGSFVTQIITLTNDNIVNKEIILSGVPVAPESVQLTPNNGIPQLNGVDFEVTLNVLSWDGLGLEGFLEVGDILIIQYSNSTNIVIENITLTQQNIDDKEVTLSSTPTSPEITSLFILGGLPQVYGIDFFVEGNKLKWNGLGLDGFLEINDVLNIQH